MAFQIAEKVDKAHVSLNFEPRILSKIFAKSQSKFKILFCYLFLLKCTDVRQMIISVKVEYLMFYCSGGEDWIEESRKRAIELAVEQLSLLKPNVEPYGFTCLLSLQVRLLI